MKLLILSDIHYPEPYSMLYGEVIKRENPDHVVLLGDNIEGREARSGMLGLHEKFVKGYEDFFQLRRTAYLLGDNDYDGGESVPRFIARKRFMNKDPFSFRLGNMFFFHGNFEGRAAMGNGALTNAIESVAELAAKAARKAGHDLAPHMIERMTKKGFDVGDSYLFLGHIHLLRRFGKTVFCGTLRKKEMVYPLSEGMGYVTVEHSRFIVKGGGIKLNRIGPPVMI